MGPLMVPPTREEVERKATLFVRGGCICLVVASVMAMLSGVFFIVYDLPFRFVRDLYVNMGTVRDYYDIIGYWNLYYIFLGFGIVGLFVGVHALTHQASLHTMAYMSIMVPIGLMAFANLGLVIALLSLVAVALVGAAWRIMPSERRPGDLPSPYGVPTPQTWKEAAIREDPAIDMEGRSTATLLKPAATLLSVATVAVMFMFAQEYPIHNLFPWQQWLLYLAVVLGFVGVALTAYRRLFPLALVFAVAVLAAAVVDIYILTMEWQHIRDILPLTFLISGSTSSLTIVYLVTARDAFVPWRATFTSRSWPTPAGPGGG